jgi:hypothetical protein
VAFALLATSGGCGLPVRDPGPIQKILAHLGERLEPPPVSPARGPPNDWGELVQVTSRNDEGQKVLQPPASDCRPLPKWRSSPSAITHNGVVRLEFL